MGEVIALAMLVGYVFGIYWYSRRWARARMAEWMNTWSVFARSTSPRDRAEVRQQMRYYTTESWFRGLWWPILLTKETVTGRINRAWYPEVFDLQDRVDRAAQYRAEAAVFYGNAREAEQQFNDPVLAQRQREIADAYIQLAKELEQ